MEGKVRDFRDRQYFQNHELLGDEQMARNDFFIHACMVLWYHLVSELEITSGVIFIFGFLVSLCSISIHPQLPT